MATGDIADFVRRLRAALPKRWFPDTSPVLTGVLTGFAAVWARLYDLRTYTIQQLRIATASGVFLDMVALDFFQGRITRNLSEPDAHFRTRLLAEILRPRATRAAVDQALFDLTGVHPIIFEPSLASDTGGYNTGGLGYNVAGGWGSILLPFQAFITAFRPAGGGISGVSGYGNIVVGISTTGGLGGYGQGSIEWASLSLIRGAITDSDIYATVAAAMPAATIGWTRGLNAGTTTGAQQNQLLPSAGFSRTVTQAHAVLTLSVGALLTSLGKASASGRMQDDANAALRAIGRSTARGVLLLSGSSISVLGAQGISRTFGRVANLTGRGFLAALSRSNTAGHGVISGVLPLTARAAAKAFGNILGGGNVAVFNSRSKAMGTATTTLAASTPLAAASRSAASGRTLVTTAGGASLLAFSKSTASGRSVMAGTTALSGRGTEKASGTALEGNNVILNGRARSLSQAKATIAARAALAAATRSKASGRANSLTLFAGALMLASGKAVATARASIAAALPLRGASRSKAFGFGSMSFVQSAPTAPTNLVASNPTSTSMILTWTASVGAGGSNDGSLLTDGGVLILATPPAGYPTSTSGLAAGQLWSNGGVVSVVPGATPNPAAAPVLLNAITAAGLLAIGGADLPLTSPAVNSGQLWNFNGEVYVA